MAGESMVPISSTDGGTQLLEVEPRAGQADTPDNVVTLAGERQSAAVAVAPRTAAAIKRSHAVARAAGMVYSLSRDNLGVAATSPDTVEEPATTVLPVSNVNPFLTGLVDLDRALAAIARVRWSKGDLQRKEDAVAAARQSLQRVAGSIDTVSSGASAGSLREIVECCIARLAGDRGGSRPRPAMAAAMVKRVRKAWVQLAVESTSRAVA